MQSFNEIRDDYLSYANSQNLEGVAIEKLCNLLAYSAYRNQLLQARHSLEEGFSTSVSLNSRIHHAANYQYSVPRGKCPVVSVSNILALQTREYNHLDYIMPFNGYYFYMDLSSEDYAPKSTTMSYPVDGGINLLCSSHMLGEASVLTSDEVYFVDFVEANNASSDYLLYWTDSSGNLNLIDPKRVTEDSSKFYYREYSSSEGEAVYEYAYDYLVITIPDYGIRVVRHSDTTSWEGSGMYLKYIPYNETTPDFTNLRTITGFTLQEDSQTGVYTTLDVIPFEPRLENLDEIYANAVSSYLQQGSVATPEDLVIALKKFNPSGYYRVYIDKKVEYDPGVHSYSVTDDGTYASIIYYGTTDVTYQEIQNEVNKFKGSFSVTSNLLVAPSQDKNVSDDGTEVKLSVEAYSNTKTLTNDMLRNLIEGYRSRIGQSLNHSQFEADVIKLGFDYVKVYDIATGKETDFNITCNIYQCPNIEAEVVE